MKEYHRNLLKKKLVYVLICAQSQIIFVPCQHFFRWQFQGEARFSGRICGDSVNSISSGYCATDVFSYTHSIRMSNGMIWRLLTCQEHIVPGGIGSGTSDSRSACTWGSPPLSGLEIICKVFQRTSSLHRNLLWSVLAFQSQPQRDLWELPCRECCASSCNACE